MRRRPWRAAPARSLCYSTALKGSPHGQRRDANGVENGASGTFTSSFILPVLASNSRLRIAQSFLPSPGGGRTKDGDGMFHPSSSILILPSHLHERPTYEYHP